MKRLKSMGDVKARLDAIRAKQARRAQKSKSPEKSLGERLFWDLMRLS